MQRSHKRKSKVSQVQAKLGPFLKKMTNKSKSLSEKKYHISVSILYYVQKNVCFYT